MFCNRCGSANPDEVRFCVNCGAPVGSPKSQQTHPQAPEYTLPSFSQGSPAQPPYPQQGYQGYQSGQPGPPTGQQGSASGRAIASMILSLVSIVTCGPFLSVPGLILGKLELDAIRAGLAPVAGEGFAKVGYYAGIAITLLSCLAGLVYMAVMFLAIRGSGT
ncbi:MAG: zinc-ribbon domain-containing protein [Acidobacteriota bacterium]